VRRGLRDVKLVRVRSLSSLVCQPNSLLDRRAGTGIPLPACKQEHMYLPQPYIHTLSPLSPIDLLNSLIQYPSTAAYNTCASSSLFCRTVHHNHCAHYFSRVPPSPSPVENITSLHRVSSSQGTASHLPPIPSAPHRIPPQSS
jgi:hypothetical protein